MRPAASSRVEEASTSGSNRLTASRSNLVWQIRTAPAHHRCWRPLFCEPVRALKAGSDKRVTSGLEKGRKHAATSISVRRESSAQVTTAVFPDTDPPPIEAALPATSAGTEDQLRAANYAVNLSFIAFVTTACCTKLFAVQASAWPDWDSWEQLVRTLESCGWEFYNHAVTSLPLMTKAAIGGIVYTLGDLTAQTYEGRTSKQFDIARLVRSGLCGSLAHAPLAHYYFQELDQLFVSLLGSHQPWYSPLLKIGVDQTAWALTWNSLYYILLGLMKLESPGEIYRTVAMSWRDLLVAGWRFWPFAHLVTYALVPTQHRLLYVDTMELAWVTVLSFYGQQLRRQSGAARTPALGGQAVDVGLEDPPAPSRVSCALPGHAGEGGSFAEEIMRSIDSERDIVIQDAEGNIVIWKAEDMYAEAAKTVIGPGLEEFAGQTCQLPPHKATAATR